MSDGPKPAGLFLSALAGMWEGRQAMAAAGSGRSGGLRFAPSFDAIVPGPTDQ